ncbi:alpha/beta hydrolase [Gallaecimonas xiamenensis]|uniref:Esterase n=1 Tax=Gallaecimonas xiamenensis 3-C-1 TaxID=745411 RepID=K2IIF9_9GAMM|nr:alpha/beta hydrolase-fold protein [Gallaecimonas xiamenensis]EKE69921.1 esterase [Gallaecimonas xiamenensis 3-C-1]
MLRVLLLCLLAFGAQARPDLSKPLGPTWADGSSRYYRFQSQLLDSADGQRHYKLTVAIPKAQAPEAGFPVLYLLDGNAAMAALDDNKLAPLAAQTLPVLVAIGYQTELRFDVNARALDYTPPALDGKPIEGERPAGGADEFLALIEAKIKPLVAGLVTIDRQRQTLWGHSFGGLFTMHVLATAPASFQAYAAADPSFWWQDGEPLARLKALAEHPPAPGTAVLIMHGGAKAKDRGPRPARGKAPPDAIRQASRQLAELPGVRVHYREYPALSHGPLLPASLLPALRLAQGHLDD